MPSADNRDSDLNAVIKGPYFNDIMAQPAAIESSSRAISPNVMNAINMDSLKQRGIRRIVLTGMGSSLHALYPLHLCLNNAGIVSTQIETAELLHEYPLLRGKDVLLILVSQSGESAEVVKLLQNGDEFGIILGITNNPDSTLGRRADYTLLLQAGEEATVSCKTYLATLSVLHQLGTLLVGEDVDIVDKSLLRVGNFVKEYLKNWKTHVSEILGLLKGAENYFVIGRSYSLATALTGGLILKESTRKHAEGMSSAAFRHGPFEMLSDRVFVLVFEGRQDVSSLNNRIAEDILSAGGRTAFSAVNNPTHDVFRLPKVNSELLPMVEILSVQMMSLAIAALDGNEAGAFERATKVTRVE